LCKGISTSPGTRRTDFYRIADGKLAEEWIALGIPVGE